MSGFREWYRWLFALPWSVKWFVLFVLFRPVIDGFYTLKELSPFLSPLYIVGVLTPFLTLFAVIRLPRPARSPLDPWFKAWAVLTGLALLFLYFRDTTSLRFFQYLFKLSMPLYIYAFLRYFIRSEKELNGILQTFLYSTLLVAGVFLYELIGGPIRVEESRGLSRIQGFFGDVVNYAIYMLQGFLVTAYFHFRNRKKKMEGRHFLYVMLALLLGIAILFNIHHAATLGIFSFLLLLFLWYERKKKPGLILLLGLGIIGGTFLYGDWILETKVEPLVSEEMEVLEGKEESSKLLHGRMGRWQRMWEKLEGGGPWALAFGYPVTFDYPYQMISAGAHNDYLRVLFFTGFFGLAVYLAILRSLWGRLRYLAKPHRFLATGGLGILLLFSITTTPSLYPPMLYVLYAIFAFMALPAHLLKKESHAPPPDPNSRQAASPVHGPLSDDGDHSRLLS